MGDWRDNKDVEIPLDGIGGVNIVVKADVHRAGKYTLAHPSQPPCSSCTPANRESPPLKASTSLATLSKTKPRPKVSRRWPGALATVSTVSRTTSSGISIRTRSLGTRRMGIARQLPDKKILGRREGSEWAAFPPLVHASCAEFSTHRYDLPFIYPFHLPRRYGSSVAAVRVM